MKYLPLDEASEVPTARSGRLGDEIYETLLNELISGKIEPGSRIMVDRLSRRLDVSQTPIREALSRLEAQALVTKTHLIGYRAAERMSRKQFEDLYEMRLLLEPFATKKCAQLATPGEIAEMELRANEMRALSGQRGESYAAFARKDAELHELIARCGGNALLTTSLTAMQGHLHLFRLPFDARVTKEALSEHDEIIKAIQLRTTVAAGKAMREHIQNSRTRLLKAYSQSST